MYKIGVFVGKFTPIHRGHINAIIQSATKCEMLYVVVSDHPTLTERLCKQDNLKLMDLKLRTKWVSTELQGFDHIKVIMLNEEGILEYPYGWTQWAEKLKEAVPERFDVIFGGETEYVEQHNINFPNVEYELYDCDRMKYPISATMIRENPLKYWDYILGSVRPHFVKRVLITGSESCSKTTITKYLAKLYNTSWVEEEGRYYSEKYLGGNEDVFTVEDFGRISYLHKELEYHADKTSNKVVFVDTDATVTQFYCNMYLGEHSDMVESFVDADRYDIVLMFKPDVKWVDDGQRWNSEEEVRYKLHEELKGMYIKRGFEDKIIEIGGTYNERLYKATKEINKLINESC